MPCKVPRTERRLCVREALRILRIKDGGPFSQIVLGQLTKLVNNGGELDEALLVARWGRKKYDEGDSYYCNIDPMYLWATSRFPLLLAAAQTVQAPKGSLSNIADADTRREWGEDYQRRVRERGLD